MGKQTIVITAVFLFAFSREQEMRSIERRFNKISKRNSIWSSFICFAEAIKEQNFSKQMIHRWFNKLVSKEDYERKDKGAILAGLDNL